MISSYLMLDHNDQALKDMCSMILQNIFWLQSKLDFWHDSEHASDLYWQVLGTMLVIATWRFDFIW